jgi:hypothetical protein
MDTEFTVPRYRYGKLTVSLVPELHCAVDQCAVTVAHYVGALPRPHRPWVLAAVQLVAPEPAAAALVQLAVRAPASAPALAEVLAEEQLTAVNFARHNWPECWFDQAGVVRLAPATYGASCAELFSSSEALVFLGGCALLAGRGTYCSSSCH